MTAKLPRILCDRCMVDADVAIAANCKADASEFELILHVRCHEEEELLRWSDIPKSASTGRIDPVLVWSNIAKTFMDTGLLVSKEALAIRSLMAATTDLQIYHRISRAHGCPQTLIGPEVIDAAIDTLLLFRKDKP